MTIFKHFLKLVIPLIALNGNAWADITGSGSSLAYPVMQELTKQYKEQKKIEIFYSSIGSGAGIREIAVHSVDFTLSDIPLTQYELTSQDLVQFPVFASAIVPVVNIPGIKSNQLIISATALADIYLGKITSWDDPALRDLNPTLNLPALPIKVIYRSDVSGTSYVFASFLSKSNVNWNTKYSIGSGLKWAFGQGVNGSVGVVQAIKFTEGSIGYLEFGSANAAKFTVPLLQVQGKNIVANYQSFVSSFDVLSPIRPSFYKYTTASTSLLSSWPIIAITNGLVQKHPNQDDNSKSVLSFFNWVYQSKGDVIESFDLLPMENKKAIASVEAQWKTITNARGSPIWVSGSVASK